MKRARMKTTSSRGRRRRPLARSVLGVIATPRRRRRLRSSRWLAAGTTRRRWTRPGVCSRGARARSGPWGLGRARASPSPGGCRVRSWGFASRACPAARITPRRSCEGRAGGASCGPGARREGGCEPPAGRLLGGAPLARGARADAGRPARGFASGGASSSSDVWDVARFRAGGGTRSRSTSGAAWSCGAVGRVVVVGGDGGGSSEASSSSHIVGPRRVTLPSGEAPSPRTRRAATSTRRRSRFRPRARGRYTRGAGARRAGHGGVADEPAPRLVAALPGGGPCVACGPRTTAAVVAPRARTTKEKAELAKAPVTFAAAAPRRRKISRPASRPESSSRAASRAPVKRRPASRRRSISGISRKHRSREGRDPLEGREQKQTRRRRRRGGAVAGFGGGASTRASSPDATSARASRGPGGDAGERRAPGRSRRAERRGRGGP